MLYTLTWPELLSSAMLPSSKYGPNAAVTSLVVLVLVYQAVASMPTGGGDADSVRQALRQHAIQLPPPSLSPWHQIATET